MKGRPGRPPVLRGCDAILSHMAALVQEEGVGYEIIEKRAGLAKGTLGTWFRRKHEPKLANVQAALNVMGQQLVIRRNRSDA